MGRIMKEEIIPKSLRVMLQTELRKRRGEQKQFLKYQLYSNAHVNQRRIFDLKWLIVYIDNNYGVE